MHPNSGRKSLWYTAQQGIQTNQWVCFWVQFSREALRLSPASSLSREALRLSPASSLSRVADQSLGVSWTHASSSPSSSVCLSLPHPPSLPSTTRHQTQISTGFWHVVVAILVWQLGNLNNNFCFWFTGKVAFCHSNRCVEFTPVSLDWHVSH